MFSVGDINFANGVYGSNGKINGMETMIMESNSKAETVINDFEKTYRAGMDFNYVLDQIMRNRGFDRRDFTCSDIKRIEKRIHEVYNTSLY